MEAFFKKQLAELQAKLQKYYINRARCGPETVGSFDILIEQTTEDILKIEEQLKKFQTSASDSQTSDLKKVVQLIEKDHLREALTLLRTTHPTVDSVIIIMGNLVGLERTQMQGTLDTQSYRQGRAQIRQAILLLIHDL